jgi:hypothetical protein
MASEHARIKAAAVAARKAEASAIYKSLCQQYALSSPFHCAMARQIAAAMLRGDLAEANRAIALLPQPVARVDASGKTVGVSEVRAKIRMLVANAIAADQIEEGCAGDSELADAHRRIESLEDEIKHLRGSKPRQLPPPSRAAMPEISERKGPIGSTAAPSSSTPAPSASSGSTPLHRPSEGAWNAWRAAGGDPAPISSGGGGGGESLGGFFSRINGREY